MAESRFPKPIRIGSRAVRWVEQEVLDFIASRPRAAQIGQPRSRDDPRTGTQVYSQHEHTRLPAGTSLGDQYFERINKLVHFRVVEDPR